MTEDAETVELREWMAAFDAHDDGREPNWSAVTFIASLMKWRGSFTKLQKQRLREIKAEYGDIEVGGEGPVIRGLPPAGPPKEDELKKLAATLGIDLSQEPAEVRAQIRAERRKTLQGARLDAIQRLWELLP